MTIYVLRSDNLVKIGFTDHLRKRVGAIIAGLPVAVEFVGHMPGDRDVEAHLHKVFAATRFSGEWFRETPDMRALFEVLLIPGLPQPKKADRAQKRVDGEVSRMAAILRTVSAHRWPLQSHADRIDRLAAALDWNRARVKDFYYGDKRVAVRAFEAEQITEWSGLKLEQADAPAQSEKE